MSDRSLHPAQTTININKSIQSDNHTEFSSYFITAQSCFFFFVSVCFLAVVVAIRHRHCVVGPPLIGHRLKPSSTDSWWPICPSLCAVPVGTTTVRSCPSAQKWMSLQRTTAAKKVGVVRGWHICDAHSFTRSIVDWIVCQHNLSVLLNSKILICEQRLKNLHQKSFTVRAMKISLTLWWSFESSEEIFVIAACYVSFSSITKVCHWQIEFNRQNVSTQHTTARGIFTIAGGDY